MANDVEIIPWQSIDDLDTYGLTEKDVNERVYWVADNDVVTGGSKAIFFAGKQLKKPWPYIATLLLLPGISFLSERIYKVVAKNRHRMPGGTAACEIDK